MITPTLTPRNVNSTTERRTPATAPVDSPSDRCLPLITACPTATLTEFRLDGGVPVWKYMVGHTAIEKRVFMPHRQNTVVVSLDLRPTLS